LKLAFPSAKSTEKADPSVIALSLMVASSGSASGGRGSGSAEATSKYS
jgi:hypothetical protein